MTAEKLEQLHANVIQGGKETKQCNSESFLKYKLIEF